jgi:hypothetical protein
MLENPFSFFKLLKSLKKQLLKHLLMKLIVLMNHNFSHTSAINDFYKIVQYDLGETNFRSHSHHNRK